MKIRLSKASILIENFIKAGLVAFLHSSPGIGKSDVVRSIASKYNLKLIDLRLSQCDPTDLAGLIQFKNGKAAYAPMDTFPLETDAIPDGYTGWLISLDEFNSAPRSVQAAAYKLTLDRMVGQHKLHKNVAIVCAGNLNTDGAIVEDMSTALQSRLCHIEIDSEQLNDDWIEWAYANNIDHRIISYIQFKPSSLYTFSADHSDKTYACPRTWGFANSVLKVTTDNSELLPMLAGTISEGVAREFMGYMRISADLPKIVDIIKNPTLISVPEEPSVLYALTGAIAHNTTEDNVSKLLEYVSRLPLEFQAICVKGMLRKCKSPHIYQWAIKHGKEFFS